MRFVLGALLGAAFGTVAMARRPPSGHRPPQPGYPGDQHTGPAADSDHPAAHGQPHRPAARPGTGEQAAPGDERQKKGERIYWWVTGAASILATGATIAAAIFAAGAYKAALESVAETRRQVAVAKEANEISNRTLAATIGASVHVGAPGFQTLPDKDGTTMLAIEVAIANEGGAAARGLSIASACRDFDAPPLDPFDAAALAASPAKRIALGPKETYRPAVCIYREAEVRRIARQRRTIVFYGRVAYRDTIEPSKARRIEFCYRMHSLNLRGETWTLGDACERHNCADEECEEEAAAASRPHNHGAD